jgi:hypothetical protein
MISRQDSPKANSRKHLLKAPSSKLQAPEKLQAPNIERNRQGLEIDFWSFSGAWSLELGRL